MPLQLLVGSSDPSTLTLILDGKLDAVTAPELEEFFTVHLTETTKTLVVNLAKLNFVSSAGLRIFAKMRKAMQAQGGKLCFVELSPQVQKVFDIVKAVPASDVFRNLEELDVYLANMQRRVTDEQRAA